MITSDHIQKNSAKLSGLILGEEFLYSPLFSIFSIKLEIKNTKKMWKIYGNFYRKFKITEFLVYLYVEKEEDVIFLVLMDETTLNWLCSTILIQWNYNIFIILLIKMKKKPTKNIENSWKCRKKYVRS